MFSSLILLSFLAQPAPSSDSELRFVAKYLQERIERHALTEYDARFLRFFTTYTYPLELRKDADLALSFVLNSTVSNKASGYIEKPKRVPGSDTLVYIDLRNYGWSIEDFEVIFGLQPYFLDPVVNQDVSRYVRQIAGNVMYRTDWAIYNFIDVSAQIDRGIDDTIYEILLYGKGKVPKTANDFQKVWKVDLKTIREEKIERGTVVDKKDSGVSKRTRQLRRARTLFGYYWETRDVLSFDNFRDFIEDPEAGNYSASELITSNKRGLQVYGLTTGTVDNKGNPDKNPLKSIQIADTGIVIDHADRRDPRIRLGVSCMHCHPTGINPATNKIRDILGKGGKLFAKYNELQEELKSFYLSDLNEDIKDDCRIFERAVRACNGLDPIENAKNLFRVYDWYRDDVTIEQGARELGVNIDDFKRELRATTSGRLVDMYYNGVIPREVWDSVKNGAYVQSVLLMKRLDNPNNKPPEYKTVLEMQLSIAYNNTPLQSDSSAVLVYIPKGESVEFVNEYSEKWFKVKYKGTVGYIHADYLHIKKVYHKVLK